MLSKIQILLGCNGQKNIPLGIQATCTFFPLNSRTNRICLWFKGRMETPFGAVKGRTAVNETISIMLDHLVEQGVHT